MPRGTKRAAKTSNDGEDENGSTHIISPSQLKRLKTEPNGDASDSNGTIMSEEEEGEDEEAEPEEEEAEENDELDEDEMNESDEETQQSQRRTSGDAGIGVIEKVSLTNFMCHNRLEVSLGPKLNFIIGHNGSGKSAILTGVTIALGGKAAATSRGSSLKSFVKEGKTSAIVEVTLKNRGDDAFKPNLYGDKIIVERVLRTDATGGSWKIKNSDGRIVSTKREELNAICDHANIQVDNPMNILTQDSARQFLSSSHADEKYQFFLKGTQLAQLAAEYEIIQVNANKIQQMLARKGENLPLLRQKAEEAQSLLEIVRKAADQKRKIGKLRDEMFWSFVQGKETDFASIQERLERLIVKREKIKAKLTEASEEIKTHETIITDLERTTGEMAEQEAPLTDKMRELKLKEKELLNSIRACKDEESNINDNYKRLKKQADDLQKRIETETSKSRTGMDEKHNGLLQQQKQAELEKKKLENDEAGQRDRIDEIDQEAKEVDEEITAVKRSRDELRNDIFTHEKLIANLRITMTNRMTAFGQNIPTLLQMIDRETRWREKPVGPIGAHLKLREGQWANVLESVIGNTLNAFCVTNHHDRNLLQELKRRAHCNEVSILTAADEEFDYTAGEPDGNVLTVLRVLDISSGYLTRQLINAMHIEQSALVKVRAEGDDLIRKRLRNVRQCYSQDMFRLSTAGTAGSSTQTLQSHRGAPRLTMDIEARMEQMQRRLEQQERRLQEVIAEMSTLTSKKEELMEERRQVKQRIPVLQRRARECHANVERIEDLMREEEPTNIAALIEAKKEYEMEMENLGPALDTIFRQIETLEEEARPVTTTRLQLKAQVEAIQEQTRNLKPKLSQAAKDRVEASSKLAHWTKALREIEPKIEDMQSSAAQAEKDVERHTVTAEARCDRIETTKSPEEIAKQIDTIESQLQAAAKKHGVENTEAVNEQVRQLLERFEKANAEMTALTHVHGQLQEAIDMRLDKWRRFRRIIAVRAKHAFSDYLSRRGYSGHLTFDHNKNTLRLTVQTEEGAAGHRDKDPKSLSGGEKSFATICLLLALWESIGCPIRCLDEFDVFMDAVNRKISMSMMIDAARNAHGVQYVLITPQSMANVDVGHDTRVHRLHDPERNQSTLHMT